MDILLRVAPPKHPFPADQFARGQVSITTQQAIKGCGNRISMRPQRADGGTKLA